MHIFGVRLFLMEMKGSNMRKHYIDNLRNLTILLLFPVHTFMIWNNFGSRFYIWQGESRILSTLIVLVNPWFMPILFVLAGMSARYALEKRTNKEFIVQRVSKLLIPFISGTIFLVPFQTLYARKFFDNYEGSLWDHWDLWVNFIGWISILVLLIAGKRFLNKSTGFTKYFNQASYPVYILHQTILVVLAYYVVQINDILLVQVFCICIGSFLLTVLAYHLIRLIPVVGKVFGVK